jgi:hypothetical protein
MWLKLREYGWYSRFDNGVKNIIDLKKKNINFGKKAYLI